MKKEGRNVLIAVCIIIMFVIVTFFSVISLFDPSFLNPSAVNELTFDCNAGADLKSEEKCKCEDDNPSGSQPWCHRHTYLLDSPMTVSGIWGTVTIWGSSHHTLRPTVDMDFLIGGTWSTKMSWTMDANSEGDGKVNSFSAYFAPVTIEGFRFCTGEYGSSHSPYIHGSAGTILVEGDPSPPENGNIRVYCYQEDENGSALVAGGVAIKIDSSVHSDEQLTSFSNGMVIFDQIPFGAYVCSVVDYPDVPKQSVTLTEWNLDGTITFLIPFAEPEMPDDVNWWLYVIITIVAGLVLYGVFRKESNKK